MSKDNIRPITMEHIQRYGDIYAKAFSGEPWNDPWKPEDAVIHVQELLESKQAYGLEYVLDGKVVGFILGTSKKKSMRYSRKGLRSHTSQEYTALRSIEVSRYR